MAKEVKRRDVEAFLRAQGCALLRTGGEHEVWGCPCGHHQAPLPRHTRISPGIVQSVETKMACLSKGWLQ